MMTSKRSFMHGAGLAGILLAATLAACGGGGGSSPAPSTPVSTPPPSIGGIAAGNGSPLANASIVFSCGCTGQAGTATADANGNYTLPVSSVATPASPQPTYTAVPGRNYLSVITSSSGVQAWDIAFLGSTPLHNHTLNATNTSDQYTTAAALYVFYNSISTTKADAFDTWNFDTIASWVSAMQTSPIAAETTLLDDITAAQTNHQSLYPSNGAAWAPAGTVPNTIIKTDLDNLQSAATAAGLTARLPQQCNGGTAPCAVPTP